MYNYIYKSWFWIFIVYLLLINKYFYRMFCINNISYNIVGLYSNLTVEFHQRTLRNKKTMLNYKTTNRAYSHNNSE